MSTAVTVDRSLGPWWKEPTRKQWNAFIAAWAGWVLDAFDFTIFLIVVPEIAAEFGVSVTAATGSLTLTLILRLVGGYGAGWLADRYGRRLPLMLSLIWFAVFDGLVALAPSFTWVLVLRTLFGLGMGAEWTAGSTLAMESWPARSRGIASGVLQGSWAIGFLLAALVSAVVVPAWGWRGLFVVAIAPALLVMPIRWWVDESDEWKATRAAATARDTRRTDRAPETRITGEVARRLAIACVVMALGFGVYYGLTTAYSTLLAREHGLAAGDRWTLLAIFNVGMLGGAIITGWAAKRYGVRLAVSVPALLMLPALPLYVGAVPGWLGVGAFLGGLLGVGFTGVVPLFLTEVFPAPVRARAVGIAYHVGAMAAALVAPLVPFLYEHAGLSLGASIAIVAGAFELVLAMVLLLSPRAAQVTGPPALATPPARPVRSDG